MIRRVFHHSTGVPLLASVGLALTVSCTQEKKVVDVTPQKAASPAKTGAPNAPVPVTQTPPLPNSPAAMLPPRQGTDSEVKDAMPDQPKPDSTAAAAPVIDRAALKEKLTPIQYAVTQENATERAFQNEFWNNHEEGIYVSIVTGKPLFSSKDKFDSGCGWPSFVKPISDTEIKNLPDHTHGMIRTEVRDTAGDGHLGHVFDDGPQDRGGLRYCINSAALRFVPKAKLKEAGYGDWLKHFEEAPPAK